jgi:hypothetical protein
MKVAFPQNHLRLQESGDVRGVLLALEGELDMVAEGKIKGLDGPGALANPRKDWAVGANLRPYLNFSLP